MQTKVKEQEKSRWITKKCKYCGKKYTYSSLVGDQFFGACGKRVSCVLEAMRDHL